MIYFDNAATTYPKPSQVYDAVNYGMLNFAFNAGRGSYSAANDTFKMIEDTRLKLSSIVSAASSNVVFTSSATESLNDIIFGLGLNENDVVFVSPFEHNAVVRTLHSLKVDIQILPIDKHSWEFDYNKMHDLFLLLKPKAIIISQISNVTGFELPYGDIFKIGKEFNTINVLDAAQGFAIYTIRKENIDFIVFAGHKSLYSVFGIAGYINISNFNLIPHKIGGTGSDSLNLNMPLGSPSRYEAGSLNSVGIYAVNQSLDWLKKEISIDKKQELVCYFINNLKKNNQIIVYSPDNYTPRGIVAFNIKGYNANDIGTILSSDYDICVRTGYHCAPFVHNFLDDEQYSGCIRASFGFFNTKEQVDYFIKCIEEIVNL